MTFVFPVMEPDRTCSISVSTTPVHLLLTSTQTPHARNCGTKTRSWKIEAPAGQQISVILMDFSGTEKYSQDNPHVPCNRFGYILDTTLKANVSICSSGSNRQTILHKSAGNIVEVVIDEYKLEPSGGDQENRILLGFDGEDSG